MVNGKALAKATRKVVETLEIVETLSEHVLAVVMVSEGYPLADVRAILDHLVKWNVLCRTDRGYVTLGEQGYHVAQDIRTYVSIYGENPIIRSTGKRAD